MDDILNGSLYQLQEIEAYITAENDDAVRNYMKERERIKALHDSVRNGKAR